MCVDELVDRGLILRFHFVELQAHAVATVGPGDSSFGIDVALGARQPEAKANFRGVLERARGSDRDAAAAEVQRQRCGDRVAEAVGDGDAEHHARAATAVEVVGEQMRCKRRQNVLHGAVLVHVAGDAQRRKLAHFFGARNRSAENQDRQPSVIKLTDAAHQVHAGGVRQTQIDDQQIELGADRRARARAVPRRS